ncbi:MAG: recombinase RecT [Lachnospiraceae bacterium]|nr:recombinase RecT [Lachnospiraceae bacterium]
MAYQRQQGSAQAQDPRQDDGGVRLMGMVNQLLPQIRKALPSIMTPERFTRITVSAIQNNPKLGLCSPVSFLGAMMNAAQLGLEPNTPLGQAYLIPYWNGRNKCYECQFQVGYKGMLALAYRTRMFQTIQVHTVYENDQFEYALGLEEKLVHVPAMMNRGNPTFFYALYKLDNGGYGFQVMSTEDCNRVRDSYSQAAKKGGSPWETNYEAMCKKTVLKQLLKYAPVSSDIMQAMTVDSSVSNDRTLLDGIVQDAAENPFMQVDAQEQPMIEEQPARQQVVWEQPAEPAQPEPVPVQQGFAPQQGFRQQEYGRQEEPEQLDFFG